MIARQLAIGRQVDQLAVAGYVRRLDPALADVAVLAAVAQPELAALGQRQFQIGRQHQRRRLRPHHVAALHIQQIAQGDKISPVQVGHHHFENAQCCPYVAHRAVFLIDEHSQ